MNADRGARRGSYEPVRALGQMMSHKNIASVLDVDVPIERAMSALFGSVKEPWVAEDAPPTVESAQSDLLARDDDDDDALTPPAPAGAALVDPFLAA